MALLLIFLTCLSLVSSIPILSDDELKLNSIVISEIDLPTEPPHTVVDQDIAVEPASTFLDLVEKYEGTYGANPDDIAVHKRSSTDEDESLVVGAKSLIDKIDIPDPEVRMEFEKELSQNSIIKDDDHVQQQEDDTTEHSQIATEYEPNYEKMIIQPQADENVTEAHHNESSLSVHDKEILQVHLVEQLVHHNEHREEFTTIVPEESFTDHALVANPEVIEVLEHIVFETERELKFHEHSTITPVNVVEMEVDPIEIIPKDRHREAKVEVPVDDNDKFAGFVGIPNEDLIQPGEETTEADQFFKNTETSNEDEDDPIDTVRETLEYVAIYGKSLNLDEMPTTTEVPQTTIYETVTEITVVNEKVNVNTQAGNEIATGKSLSSDESSQQSESNKSSEESKEKQDKSVSSEELESENVGKEDLSDDQLSLRSLLFPITQRPNSLPDDIFKDTKVHEIKKKDHPDGLVVPYEVVTSRQLQDEVPVTTSTVETITKVYEAFEEVITAVSDGIKLTKELRHHVESFRDHSEENKIVMDTHSEPFSAKNSKNPLVNVIDLEMMKLKERTFDDEPKVSIAVIPLVAIISVIVLVTLYTFIKAKASTVRFY